MANCGEHTDRRVIQCQLPGDASVGGFRTVYAFEHDSTVHPLYDSAAHPAARQPNPTPQPLFDGSITADAAIATDSDAKSALMINGRFVYFFFKDTHNSSISEFIHYHAHPVLEDGALATHSSLCDETGMDGYPHAPPGPPAHRARPACHPAT